MGPPIPVGPLGRKGKGASPWWAGAPYWALPHAPRVETLGEGGAPYALGGKFPPRPPPPLQMGSAGGAAAWGGDLPPKA